MYDHWIALCTVKHGKIFCIENRFNLYRQHEGQVCGLESMQNNACSIEVLKRKITNWTRDAQLFHTIGVPKWKFFYYKIKSNIIKS